MAKGNLVDQLGVLAAEIAELTAKEASLKAILADFGKGVYEGTSYRATVSIFNRVTLNMKAVRAKLTRQFIKANSTSKPVTVVKVVARKRDVLGQPVNARIDLSRLKGPDGESIPV